MDMVIEPSQANAVREVALTGTMDLSTAAGLRTHLRRLVTEGPPRLALNLGGVEFIDCTGLGVLLDVRRACQAEGGRLQVRAASHCVQRIVALTGSGALLDDGE